MGEADPLPGDCRLRDDVRDGGLTSACELSTWAASGGGVCWLPLNGTDDELRVLSTLLVLSPRRILRPFMLDDRPGGAPGLLLGCATPGCTTAGRLVDPIERTLELSPLDDRLPS